MRFIIIYIILSFIACHIHGQAVIPKISLEKRKGQTQINLVDEMIEQARLDWLSGMDSLAYAKLEKAIIDSKKLNYAMGEANARSQWVRIEMDYQDQEPLAQRHLDTMFQLAKKAKMPLIEGIALFRRAQIDYDFPERYENAMKMLHHSNEIFKSEGNKQWEALYYSEYGSVLTYKGQYYEALDLLLKAKKIQDKYQLVSNLKSTISSIANIYLMIKKYDLALKFSNEGEHLADSLNDLNTKVFYKNQKGVILNKQFKFKAAITQFKGGISIQEPMGKNQRLVSMYANLADAYIKTNDLDSSQKYNDLAKTLHKKLTGEQSWGFHTVFINDAKIALLKGKLSEAIEIANFGLTILEKSDITFPSEKKEYYEILSNAYERNGESRKAFENYKNYQRWSDTIYNQDINTQLLEKAYNYEISKNEQNSKLNLEKVKHQKLITTRNLLIIISIIGFFSTLYILRTNKKLKEINLTLKTKNLEIENALYQGQNIERRRLAAIDQEDQNAQLTTLRSLIKAIDPDQLDDHNSVIYKKLIDMTTSVTNVDELIFHNTLPGVLEQDGIVAATHALVSKLTVQYNTLFNIKEEDHIGRFQIEMEHQLYQIILESINNIVKHADASFVNINFKKVDSLFIATLEDDGRGMDVNRNNEGKGISKMISLANKMGGEYKIENLLPNGTKIWVKVPIEEHSKN